MNERRQARSRWVALAALAAGLLVLLTPLNERWSRPLLDLQLRLLAPATAPGGVLVVDIDDASLAALRPQFGVWPYKRDVYALAIERLRDLGARAVALDLLLVDPQPGDAALARSLARPGAPVVLAAAGLRQAGDGSRLATDLAATAAARPAPGQPQAAAHAWPTIVLPTVSVWPNAQLPPAIGVITSPVDDDGVLRRLPLWHEADGRQWPLLPLALHQLLGPQTQDAPPPLNTSGALLLALASAAAAPPVLPLGRLLASPQPDALAQHEAALRQQVKGQVIFIGSSALLGDAVMTVQGQASGTRVLAQAYTALRDGSGLQPPAAWANAALLGLALLPGLTAVGRRRVQARQDVLAHLAALLAVCGLAAWWLLQARQPTLWAAPLVALAVGVGTALLLHMRQQVAAERRLAHELAVAAEASRAKGQFLANVSHEIRTPLNALMGVAELLAESELNPTQRHQVQLFQEAGQSLHALINDLLDLSKIEAQRLELEVAPFALHSLLQRQVALLQPQAQRKGLTLRLEQAPDLPIAVLGDRLRLERALTNLMSNAVKFTARGQVLLRAGRDGTLAHGLRFEVVDTGIGIAPSKLDSVFEPFAQADGSVTRLYGGTGLGLALTRSVAALMGGEVEVHSQPGQGSTFSLRLPLPAVEPGPALRAEEAGSGEAGAAPLAAAQLAPGADVAAAAPGAAATVALARRRVLLAEDNEVNSYLFITMLADQALDIDLAPDGLAALELLRRRPYDLAFVDVQMPGLDGLSLTRQWRAWEQQHGLAPMPMVSLTANAFASDVKASLDAGSTLHLAKPFAKQQLLDALNRLAPAAGAALPAAPAQVGPDFDPQLARVQLGVDADTHQRVMAHAAVFLQSWPAGFMRAQAEGRGALALRLTEDLQSVATRLGATALSSGAATLHAALARGDAAAARAAQQAVQAALPPLLVVLGARVGQRGPDAAAGSPRQG